MLKKASVIGFIALMCVNLSALADEPFRFNMTPGVTPVSEQIYGLHMLIFWICVAIGVIVFTALFITLIAHRKSPDREPSQFHESTTLEMAWTAVPFLILIGMAFPASKAVVNIYNTETDVDMEVKITGYQWKWRYDYLGTDVGFFSNLDPASNEARQLGSGIDPATVPNYLREVDEPLVVPVNKKIRFLITANDVLHSWWVPALGVKKDAIPGFVNEAWASIQEPGIYRGQCAELCGKDHGFMPIVVKAVPEDEFQAWLDNKHQEAEKLRELTNQTFTFDESYARGEQVYGTFCAACHGPTGEGTPNLAPALKGSAVALGPIQKHLETVVKGVPGTAMQAFGAQLSEVDLAAVVTFERSAWGNDKRDVAQPLQVLQMKQ